MKNLTLKKRGGERMKKLRSSRGVVDGGGDDNFLSSSI